VLVLRYAAVHVLHTSPSRLKHVKTLITDLESERMLSTVLLAGSGGLSSGVVHVMCIAARGYSHRFMHCFGKSLKQHSTLEPGLACPYTFIDSVMVDSPVVRTGSSMEHLQKRAQCALRCAT